MATLEQLHGAFQKAVTDEDEVNAEVFAGEIKRMQTEMKAPFQQENRVDINKAVGAAQDAITVDPLAAFRKQPRTLEQATRKPGEEFDPFKGLVHIGRGADTLSRGAQQIGAEAGRMSGFLSDEGAEREQSAIHAERSAAEQPYGRLAGKQPAAAVVGNIVGETAPFANVPGVPRVVEATAPLVKRAGGYMSQLLGEAGLGAAEAGLPYVEPGESRLAAATTGAAGAAAVRLPLDVIAKRSNVRNERMGTPELQEMHDLGKEFGIPVRHYDTTTQQNIAGEVADTFTGRADEAGRMASSFQESHLARKEELGKEYTSVLDSVDGSVQGDNPTRKFAMTELRQEVGDLWYTEAKREGLASKPMLKEFENWIDSADTMTLKDMQNFRMGLRKKTRTIMEGGADLPKEQIQSLEAAVTKHMVRSADSIQPGAGAHLAKIDKWYREDVAMLENVPALKQQLGDDFKPTRVMEWVTAGGKASNINPLKQKVYRNLSEDGKQAVQDAAMNSSYEKAASGQQFKPLTYANNLDGKIEALGKLGAPVTEMRNLSKLMRHIGKEGKASDKNLLSMIRGFPFIYRSITDAVRLSNFRYMMRNASPDIKPGSPAMESFYRSVIRGVAIQDEERDSVENITEPTREAAGRLYQEGSEAKSRLGEFFN